MKKISFTNFTTKNIFDEMVEYDGYFRDNISTISDRSFAVRKIFPGLGLLNNSEKIDQKRNFSVINILDEILISIDDNFMYPVVDKRPWFKVIKSGFINGIRRNKEFKGLNISFSSSPWDIGTMSMRGIKSCMNWGSNQARTLAGSIIDPCCAVIYISDPNEKTPHSKYGNTMLARSVVRYVRNIDQTKDFLFLEQPYRYKKTFKDPEKLFIEYLFDKTEMQVITNNDKSLVIPFSPDVRFISTETLSYRDSGLKYSFDIPADFLSPKFKFPTKAYESKFI